MEPNLLDCVIHWKKKLDKYPDDQNIILNVIRKLSKIPITVEILEATHIGKTIRNLSKRDDIVGENAKTVLNKWRNIFINLESARNAKEKSTNSKNTADKSSSKHNSSQIKNVSHHKKESFGELKEKQKKHSSHHSSSKQSSNSNSSSVFSHSFIKPQVDHLNDMNDYDNIDGIISCNNLELALSYDKSPNSSDSEEKSIKRKLIEEEKADVSKNSHKKRKLENHMSCSSEEKKKFKIVVDEGESFCQNLNKEQGSSVKHSSSKYLKKAKNDDSKNKKKKTVETEKSKVKVQSSDGFTSSSISFEDCLGFNDILPVKKKKSSVSQCSTKKPHSDSAEIKKKSGKKITGDSHNVKKSDKVVSKNVSHSSKSKTSDNMPKKSIMFDPPKANSPSLTAVQSSFTLSQNQSTSSAKKESLKNEDVIKFTSSRKEKTAIYSGRKSCNKSFPTLAQCCYRVLIENIDILGPLFDTPYTLIKPVLEKCTPNQLFTLERYNPYLLDDTNELWEIHCKRDYKLLSPLEHETWRDVYLRGFDEREEKLKNITANISASMLKATPARQLKLAFIDSDAKPPREVLRRQAKARLLESGTDVAKPVVIPKVNAKKTATVPYSTVSSKKIVIDKNELVETKGGLKAEMPSKNPSPKGNSKTVSPAVDPSASNKDIIALSLAAKKPKVAPLMAKTLKALKQSFRR